MLSREKPSKAVGLGLILRAAGWKAYVPESQLLSRLFFGGVLNGGIGWPAWRLTLVISGPSKAVSNRLRFGPVGSRI